MSGQTPLGKDNREETPFFTCPVCGYARNVSPNYCSNCNQNSHSDTSHNITSDNVGISAHPANHTYLDKSHTGTSEDEYHIPKNDSVEKAELMQRMQELKIPYVKRIKNIESYEVPYHIPAHTMTEEKKVPDGVPPPMGDWWPTKKNFFSTSTTYTRTTHFSEVNGISYNVKAIVEIIALCQKCHEIYSYQYDIAKHEDIPIPKDSVIQPAMRSVIIARNCPKCGYVQRWMRWGIIRNRIGGLLLQTLFTFLMGPGLLSLVVYLIWKPTITFSPLSILSGLVLLAWLVGISIWGLILYLFGGAALKTKPANINPWVGEADGCFTFAMGLAVFMVVTVIFSGIGVAFSSGMGASVIEGIVLGGLLPVIFFPLIIPSL